MTLVKDFFEKNKDGESLIIIKQGNLSFLWIGKKDGGGLELCDFEGARGVDISELNIEDVIIEWLNEVYPDPDTVNDIKLLDVEFKNGRFSLTE